MKCIRLLGVAAFAVRGEYDPYTRIGGDTEKYLAIAISLSRGEGFSQHYRPVLSDVIHGRPVPPLSIQPTANRSPGYPVFLAAAFSSWRSPRSRLTMP